MIIIFVPWYSKGLVLDHTMDSNSDGWCSCYPMASRESSLFSGSHPHNALTFRLWCYLPQDYCINSCTVYETTWKTLFMWFIALRHSFDLKLVNIQCTMPRCGRLTMFHFVAYTPIGWLWAYSSVLFLKALSWNLIISRYLVFHILEAERAPMNLPYLLSGSNCFQKLCRYSRALSIS